MPRHAFRFPILEPDRIDQHELIEIFGKRQRVAHAEHSADRMTDDRGAIDPQRGQKRAGVAGELLERKLIVLRLGRFAEPDLIGRDHAVARRYQHRDGVLPGRRAEILAVKQHGDLAVGCRRRLHVHVGHVHGFALGREGEMRHRPRIIKTLQLRAVGRLVVGRERTGGSAAGHGHRDGDAQHRQERS